MHPQYKLKRRSHERGKACHWLTAFSKQFLSEFPKPSYGRARHGVIVDINQEWVNLTGFLVFRGCKAFQGYLFGRTVPVDQLTLD
jgi:hypothetical protein